MLVFTGLLYKEIYKYKAKVVIWLYFFYGKDKANERNDHLMVSNHCRPRLRATPEKLEMRCRPRKSKIYYCSIFYLLKLRSLISEDLLGF